MRDYLVGYKTLGSELSVVDNGDILQRCIGPNLSSKM